MKNPDSIKSFGKRLAELRKSKNLSQQALADEADIAKSTIQRIEKGTLVITLDTVYTIAKALDVNVSELFLSNQNE